MSSIVLRCGKMFDGVSETLSGPIEILIEGKRISSMGRSVERSPEAEVIDLSDRTVSPGFIDTHVHLTMDAARLAWQTLNLPRPRRPRIHELRLHDLARSRQRR